MICPHCNYKHGYHWENLGEDPVSSEFVETKGIEGGFYQSPIKMERNNDYGYDDRVNLYGCPSCFKTFIFSGS